MLARVALLLAVSAGLAAAAPNQLPVMVTDSYEVDFNGNSGGFKMVLLRSNGTSSVGKPSKRPCKDFVNMRYQQVYELDPTGRQVGSNWSPNFNLVAGTRTFMPNNVSSVYVDGTAFNSNNGATFTIKNDLFKNSSVVVMGNQTISVTKNVLKISFIVQNWPFRSINNTLAVSLKLNTNDKPSDIPSRSKSGKNVQLKISPEDDAGVAAVFDLETYAYVDGSTTASNVAVTQSGNIYTIGLPYFASSIFYDPSLYSSGAASGTALSAGALLALVAAMAFTASKDEEESG